MPKPNQVQYDILQNGNVLPGSEITLLDQYYKFENIPRTKRQRIINLLGYCKEIRNTEYPLPNSDARTLEIVEFTAKKAKDLIYVNGSLMLDDGSSKEVRTMEAYIFEKDGNITIYLDVTRLNVGEDEQKLIRTTDSLVETGDSIMSVTKYASLGYFEEKIFQEEFPAAPELPINFYKKTTPIK